MTSDRMALVLGATGGIGGAIAKALCRRGWTVRALVRDPAKAEAAWTGGGTPPIWVAGDAMNRDDVVAAAVDASAIVHAVHPPGYRNWDRLVLPMMANSIAAARAAGGARVVLPGTIYNCDPARTPSIDAATSQQPGRARERSASRWNGCSRTRHPRCLASSCGPATSSGLGHDRAGSRRRWSSRGTQYAGWSR